MTKSTILLLLLSLLLAAGLSFYQYLFKVKIKSKVHLILAFLRFVSIFGVLLLLVNPIITQKTFEISKTPLPIVVDNSSSILDLNAKKSVIESFEKLAENKELKDKFDVQTFQFDNEMQQSNVFNFKGNQTNIDAVAKSLESIFRNSSFPTVLITDGNQTSGNDFVFSFDSKNKVYPIIVGDTTRYLDLKVSQVNANKYAFHKNKFPVEVFLNYAGNQNCQATFSISEGKNVLNKQVISFSSTKKTAIVNVLLPADKIGLHVFKATISSPEKEKNNYNNSKNFAVEIINQKSKIALISSINHPDIGALKRAIETNAQRKVTILKPTEAISLEDFGILILYQPTSEFKSVFEKNISSQKNSFIITGTHTDFTFLNQYQKNITFKMSNQKEDYLAGFNADFSLFATENLGFENFSPLQNLYGKMTTNGVVSTLLSSRIRAMETNSPLLAFAETNGTRAAFLLGENSWKWRMQSHVENQSYEKFDVFVDKIMQFLASNDAKKSLVVTHERFYTTNEAIAITAQYFNKNYEFDEKARLTISVTNKETKETKNYDLLKKDNYFKVNLNGLKEGNYTFLVKELNSKTSYSSQFQVVDFDIEKQFVNPDVEKLEQLAKLTNGTVFYPNQVDRLIKTLLDSENYKPIQKETIVKKPLIDWVLLLILLSITLATEWFIRKYYGMV